MKKKTHNLSEPTSLLMQKTVQGIQQPRGHKNQDKEILDGRKAL
jgi:hypothetical protein